MKKETKRIDKRIFFICLVGAVILFFGSFLLPPMGEIHPSCLKAGGILLGFAALGIAGQNLADGKEVTFTHDNTEVTIGDAENREE